MSRFPDIAKELRRQSEARAERRDRRRAVEKKSHARYRRRHRARLNRAQRERQRREHSKAAEARARWEEKNAWLRMRVITRDLLAGALADAGCAVVGTRELDNPLFKFQLRGRTRIETLREPLPW